MTAPAVLPDQAEANLMLAADQRARAKAKHTPGPWRVETAAWGTQIHAGHVCQVVYVAEMGCDGEPKSGDDEANARLIAAAPDLLTQLIAMLNWSRHPATAVPRAAAEVAIARATGAA